MVPASAVLSIAQLATRARTRTSSAMDEAVDEQRVSQPEPAPEDMRNSLTPRSSRSSQGSSTEELRAPSLLSLYDLSPRSVLQRTLSYLLQGMASDDDEEEDDSLDSQVADDLEAPRASTVNASHKLEVLSCQICFDEVPMDDACQLSDCGHRFCASCFTQFLTLKISEGSVSLTCFFETNAMAKGAPAVCGAAIAHEDIKQLVAPSVLAKFEKFRFNQSHTYARQCPHCDHSQVCHGPEVPQCVCIACDRPFCFTHGNTHDAGMSCTQYDKQQVRADKRNHRMIKRISKRCPQCQSPVEKNGGCNHMRCVTCRTDFCWLCGEALSELVFDHYDWTNMRGCAGQQMAHIHGLTATNKCLLFASQFVFYVVIYPIAFVLTLVVMLLSCFFAVCVYHTDVTFVQVFRWVFRVIAISGYTAIEYTCVTIVTGFAAAIFGICWVFHQLYKLGKRSVKQCWEWRKRRCATGSCSVRCCGRLPSWQQKTPEVAPLSSPVAACHFRVY